MARPRLTLPAYRKHRQTGRAAVSIYRQDGTRTEIILPGRYGSRQSKEEYERLLCQLRANDGKLPADKDAADITIAELIERFMQERVVPYYLDPVTKEPTHEQGNMTLSMRPLNRLHGDIPAAEFTPQMLVAVRKSMIDGTWHTEAEQQEWTEKGRKIGLARKSINERIGRIKLMFKWGASVGIVPASVWHALTAVEGLRRGRSGARETKPVMPVSIHVVQQTMAHMPPVVADIVELLLLTGMRVGEAAVMRAVDIDMTGTVWLYRPTSHKNQWRGIDRVIAIGPKAQEIVRRYLKPRMDAYLFSPREQRDMIYQARRAARKTKVQPSQLCRTKANPKKLPGERFEAAVVNNAIREAIHKAFPMSAELRRRAKEDGKPETDREWFARLTPEQREAVANWRSQYHWHTHQLRHTAALEISRRHGLEAARAILGHRTVQMSAHYSGLDQATAVEVMLKIG